MRVILTIFECPGWSVPRKNNSNDQFSVKINSTRCIVYREYQAVPDWVYRGLRTDSVADHHSPAQTRGGGYKQKRFNPGYLLVLLSLLLLLALLLTIAMNY